VSYWKKLEDFAKQYAREKIDAGRFSKPGDWNPQFAPTYDLMKDNEISR
jgi:hypothetical protein